jgi:voltage-gated potassium channel
VEEIPVDKKEIKDAQVQAADAAILHSSIYDLFIVFLTVFSLILVVVLAFFPISDAVFNTLIGIDWLICIIFLADFTRNMVQAPDKRGYFLKGGGWLDLLGSIPPFPGRRWTSIFRLFRVARLYRIIPTLRARGPRALWDDLMANRAQSALLITAFIAVVVITITAVVVLQVETRSDEANITTGGDAFWWAFVTITTVGFGDKYPTTGLGRIMAMILMTVGVGIFGVLTSYLATTFLAPQDEDDDDQKEDVHETTDSTAPGTLPGELAAVRAQMVIMNEAMRRLDAQLREMSDNKSG